MHDPTSQPRVTHIFGDKVQAEVQGKGLGLEDVRRGFGEDVDGVFLRGKGGVKTCPASCGDT